jgi:hypothetical protein
MARARAGVKERERENPYGAVGGYGNAAGAEDLEARDAAAGGGGFERDGTMAGMEGTGQPGGAAGSAGAGGRPMPAGSRSGGSSRPGSAYDSGSGTRPDLPGAGRAGGYTHETQLAAAHPAPADIPPPSTDDVVARQLREQAERETDATLRAKLWNEYRKYKGLPLQ